MQRRRTPICSWGRVVPVKEDGSPVLSLHTAGALISAGPGPALTLAKGCGVARAAKTWEHPRLGAQEASWQLPPARSGQGG